MVTGNRVHSVRIALIRHGESDANANDVFTGLSDPPLTSVGIEQAAALAKVLRGAGLRPNRVFSSPLRRCTHSAQLLVGEWDHCSPEWVLDEALNERDYGALTGMHKSAAVERFGESQVTRWRNSYEGQPPGGESLRDTAARVLSFYVRTILPAAMNGGVTYVVSCGNTMRALVMTLDGLDGVTVEDLVIRNSACFVYRLGPSTAVVGREILQN